MVGNQLVGGVDDLEAADRHALAQFGEMALRSVSNHLLSSSTVGVFLGSGFGNEVGGIYEACVFGNEVGFAVYFNQCADIAVDGVIQPLSAAVRWPFAGFRAGFDAQ